MSRPFLRPLHLAAALLVNAYGGGELSGVKLLGDNASIPAATTHSLSIAARGANNVR